jgi:hypothetical protein
MKAATGAAINLSITNHGVAVMAAVESNHHATPFRQTNVVTITPPITHGQGYTHSNTGTKTWDRKLVDRI